MLVILVYVILVQAIYDVGYAGLCPLVLQIKG